MLSINEKTRRHHHGEVLSFLAISSNYELRVPLNFKGLCVKYTLRGNIYSHLSNFEQFNSMYKLAMLKIHVSGVEIVRHVYTNSSVVVLYVRQKYYQHDYDAATIIANTFSCSIATFQFKHSWKHKLALVSTDFQVQCVHIAKTKKKPQKNIMNLIQNGTRNTRFANEVAKT